MIRWQYFRVLLGHEPWHVEFWSAAGMMMLWAMLTFGPAAVEGESNWRFLSGLVSDDVLGTVTFLLGVAQFTAACADHKWGRMIMAFGAAVFWLVLAHSLWMGNPTSPGVVPFLTLGLQNLASVLLIRLRPQRHWHDA